MANGSFKKAHQIYLGCQCQWHHPPPAGCQRNTVQCQLSANVNQYQLVSTSIKLVVSSECQKVTFSSTPQEKWLFGCLWLRPRIRAHYKPSVLEAEQLLGLFQYIFLLFLYQFPSSNLGYKLKSKKAP